MEETVLAAKAVLFFAWYGYAVLSRISILTDLRVFCANFGSEKMRLCYFLRFFHVWVGEDCGGAAGHIGHRRTCALWHIYTVIYWHRLGILGSGELLVHWVVGIIYLCSICPVC